MSTASSRYTAGRCCPSTGTCAQLLRGSRRARRRRFVPSAGGIHRRYALLTPGTDRARSSSPGLAAPRSLLIMSFQEYGRAQVFGARPSSSASTTTRRSSPTRSSGACWAALCLHGRHAWSTTIGARHPRRAAPEAPRHGAAHLVSVGLLLAWAMPPLSATIVWGWIFDTQYGVLNNILTTGSARLRGPLLAASIRSASSSSLRSSSSGARYRSSPSRLRGPDAGSRRGARGRTARRRGRVQALLPHRRALHQGDPRDRHDPAGDLGPPRVHPDLCAAVHRRPRASRPTPSASTSTACHSARATSASAVRCRSSSCCMLVAVSIFYVRRSVKEEEL